MYAKGPQALPVTRSYREVDLGCSWSCLVVEQSALWRSEVHDNICQRSYQRDSLTLDVRTSGLVPRFLPSLEVLVSLTLSESWTTMHIPSLLVQTEISWEANLLMPFCFHCVQDFADSDVLMGPNTINESSRFSCKNSDFSNIVIFSTTRDTWSQYTGKKREVRTAGPWDIFVLSGGGIHCSTLRNNCHVGMRS